MRLLQVPRTNHLDPIIRQRPFLLCGSSRLRDENLTERVVCHQRHATSRNPPLLDSQGHHEHEPHKCSHINNKRSTSRITRRLVSIFNLRSSLHIFSLLVFSSSPLDQLIIVSWESLPRKQGPTIIEVMVPPRQRFIESWGLDLVTSRTTN